jgi:hypothetical protein
MRMRCLFLLYSCDVGLIALMHQADATVRCSCFSCRVVTLFRSYLFSLRLTSEDYYAHARSFSSPLIRFRAGRMGPSGECDCALLLFLPLTTL